MRVVKFPFPVFGAAFWGKNDVFRRLYGQKNLGAVLVKTNVLLVLPNKLAELGAVYDCLH